MGKHRILFFVIIWVTSVVPVFSDKCPTGPNDPVNITFLYSTPQTSVTWNKNNVFISGVAKTGCTVSDPTTDYNFYCENDGKKYTLRVLQHAEGDVFDIDPSDGSQTIVYREPANMTVDITSPVKADNVLSSTATISMECKISSCTKPQPNIKWQYTTDGGITRYPITNSYTPTLNDTGCTGTLQDINSKIDISKNSVNITDPFNVICVLSYDECDKRFEKITDYTITITGTTGGSDGLTTGIKILIGIVVVVILVGGGVVVGWFCYKTREKKKRKKTDRKNDTALQATDTNGRQAPLIDKNDVEKADKTPSSNSGHKMKPLDKTTKDQQTTTNKSVGPKNTSASTNNKSEMTTSQPDGSTNTPRGITETSAATTKQESNPSINRPLPQPSNQTPNMLVNNPLPPIVGQRLK